MTQGTTLADATRTSGLGLLLWPGAAGAPPSCRGVVPLLLDEDPVVALPWSDEGDARAVAAAGRAVLVLDEPRLAAPGWTPLLAAARVRLVEDPDGDLVRTRLLDQELRKHPPSRALVDSPLLRRENWWYLPRLVLLLEVDEVRPVPPREGPRDAVLAVDDGRLHVHGVRVGGWEDDAARPAVLAVEGGPDGVAGPALLVGQEVSPDAERWTVHRTTGTWADGRLAVSVHPSTRALPPVPGLLARARRQRALARACTAGLRAAGHA